MAWPGESPIVKRGNCWTPGSLGASKHRHEKPALCRLILIIACGLFSPACSMFKKSRLMRHQSHRKASPCTLSNDPTSCRVHQEGFSQSCTPLRRVGGSCYTNAAASSLTWRPAVHRNPSRSGTSQQGTCVGLFPASGLHTTFVPTRCRRSIRLIQDPTCVMNTITCQSASHVLGCPDTKGKP